MTKNRNKIGIEKASKLCNIYRSLLNKQENVSDDDEEINSESDEV